MNNTRRRKIYKEVEMMRSIALMAEGYDEKYNGRVITEEEMEVIFYPKKSHLTTPSRRTVRLNVFGGLNTSVGENILPLRRSPLCYNVDTSDGTLRESVGLEHATFVDDSGSKYTLPDKASV